MPTLRSKRQRAEENVSMKEGERSNQFTERLKRFKYDHEEGATLPIPNRQHASPHRPKPGPTASAQSTPSPRKKSKRPSSTYAPPSKYAHLPPLTDVLTPNLIAIFIGTNPGIRTSTTGHAYAHPSNLFWKLLHSSGCTETRLRPTQDVDLPRLCALGNTNIVSRPTRDAGELSKAEMVAGAAVLDRKVARFRPEAVCVVGKGIWEAIWRHWHGRPIGKHEFRYGWQDDSERMGKVLLTEAERGAEHQDGEEGSGNDGHWEGARVFVACSTSGLSASLRPPEKEAVWKPFGEWVRRRREERSKDGLANPVWEGANRVKMEDGDLKAET